MMQDITIQDAVKRLYQAHFGGGHMITSPEKSLARLQAECAGLTPTSAQPPLFELLPGPYVRMHLRPLLQTGLSLQTANALFVYSANHAPAADQAAFIQSIRAFAKDEADHAYIENYIAAGCPAVSHSEAYREACQPAYRVVLKAVADAFALILRMDAMRAGVIAIDGPCASGKSTLASLLSGVFGARTIPLDDFFLQPHQRTPDRLAQPGGNFDRERFLQEVHPALLSAADITYRPYDCAVQALSAPVTLTKTPLTIVEGAYSHHPDLAGAYDLRVFTEIDPATQIQRIRARNGEAMLTRFETEWIPMEKAYFDCYGIPAKADITLPLGAALTNRS